MPLKINGITVDPSNSSIAYVMLASTGNNSVWRTINGGLNWTNISTGLPAVAAYAMVIDPRTTGGFANGHIDLATEVGVFVSTNLGWRCQGQQASRRPFSILASGAA